MITEFIYLYRDCQTEKLAPPLWNLKSSRSHVIFTCIIEAWSKVHALFFFWLALGSLLHIVITVSLSKSQDFTFIFCLEIINISDVYRMYI